MSADLLLSLETKQQLCCEYIGQETHSVRDRLEVRVDRSTNTPFASLKRDQFANGYESKIDTESSNVLRQYYKSDLLLRAHEELERIGTDLMSMLCSYMGYLNSAPLFTALASENETPGVLRFLRYVREKPTESANAKTELAIDHTDIGLITLMPFSAAKSLQILSPTFDWIDVEEGRSSDTVVAIVGEQLAYISNYLFEAVRHRVVETDDLAERISFPFLMRAPADLEITQIGTKRRRPSKEILNHIFELPPKLQLLAKTGVELATAYREAIKDSKRNTHVVAAVLACPKVGGPVEHAWDLLLFFDAGLPSSTSHRRFTKYSSYSAAKSPLQTHKDDDITRKRYRTSPNGGWQKNQWPSGVESFSYVDEEHSIALNVNMVSIRDHVGTDEAHSDLAWTARSSLVLFGRKLLEQLFDLNSHRID